MITIDPDLFEFDDSLGYSLETFVVTDSFDRQTVLQALARASERFLRVGQDGSEDLDPEEAAVADIFVPSYVPTRASLSRALKSMLMAAARLTHRWPQHFDACCVKNSRQSLLRLVSRLFADFAPTARR